MWGGCGEGVGRVWIGRGHTDTHTKLHGVQLALCSGAICMHAHVHIYIYMDVTTGMTVCTCTYIRTYTCVGLSTTSVSTHQPCSKHPLHCPFHAHNTMLQPCQRPCLSVLFPSPHLSVSAFCRSAAPPFNGLTECWVEEGAVGGGWLWREAKKSSSASVGEFGRVSGKSCG